MKRQFWRMMALILTMGMLLGGCRGIFEKKREALDVASRFSFWMYECNLEHVFMLKGQIIHDIMSDSESEACLHGYGERRN